MGFLNQQVLAVRLWYAAWAPRISFDVKKEALKMLGGGCYLFSPHLSVAAKQTKKAQDPFHRVLVFATKSIRHSV